MPKSWVKTAEMVVGNLILTINVFSLQASDEGNVSGWEEEGEELTGRGWKWEELNLKPLVGPLGSQALQSLAK